MIGLFFVQRTGTDSYSYGITTEDKGISFVADVQEDGIVLKGVEADFIRSRINADGTGLLAGTQGIGGLVFCSPVGQVKKINVLQ